MVEKDALQAVSPFAQELLRPHHLFRTRPGVESCCLLANASEKPIPHNSLYLFTPADQRCRRRNVINQAMAIARDPIDSRAGQTCLAAKFIETILDAP
jgi:hypothetical protein